jgi:hypothetical protein
MKSFLQKREAEKFAQSLRENDNEWTFAVQQASDGHWYIVCYDEHGEYVGAM